jgi:hypothetical protein
MKLRTFAHLALVAAAAAACCAHAGVTADEAAKLKTTLTPLGAEKAANAAGTIPAWTGGFTTPIPGDKPAAAAATRSRARSRCTASPPPTWRSTPTS